MTKRDELQALEAARAAWIDDFREPRDLACSSCSARLGTLFYVTWAEQPLMDAMADYHLGGIPTQGFYVLVSQDEGPLVPLQGRRRYTRGERPDHPLPPTWVGLPGEITCGHCRAMNAVPHPRFPQQAKLEATQAALGREPRRRWRRK